MVWRYLHIKISWTCSLCSFACKVVCIDGKYSKSIVVYRGVNASYEFIRSTLKEHKYCKKIMKKYFKKNLIMTEREEYLFQQSNSCWICKKIIIDDDEKRSLSHY